MSHEIEELKGATPVGTKHIEGNALLYDKHGAVRKLPVPSDDPRDPLNFKKWEKYAVVFCCCWFCELPWPVAITNGL